MRRNAILLFFLVLFALLPLVIIIVYGPAKPELRTVAVFTLEHDGAATMVMVATTDRNAPTLFKDGDKIKLNTVPEITVDTKSNRLIVDGAVNQSVNTKDFTAAIGDSHDFFEWWVNKTNELPWLTKRPHDSYNRPPHAVTITTKD